MNAQKTAIPNVAVWSSKGGVGKTTLAFHLTDAMATRGYNVALLDLDPQGSTTSLSEANDRALAAGETTDRGFLFDLYPDSKELGALQAMPKEWTRIVDSLAGAGHQMVVAEYGPGIPGVVLGNRHDLVLVPFQPCQTDFTAALRGVQSLPKGVKVVGVLTRYKRASPSHQVFFDLAQETFGADNVLVMQEATVFQTCNNLGRSVYTLKERVYGLGQAKAAMDLMAQKVLKELGLPLDITA
jgi:cellulose biosynthesis protein BcsQ